ncbi:TonB-dependent receptor [Psychrobium sp. MM17-31]|uniref:TonB-dependent receptor n=1 Tax=Psychrobium sp. MM17-31 TaxID=2917758 RepID=UPI001EF5B5A3|nr:TonB-dependent receptor [Psychrobium sp. MM17-31]MCG7531108.1 TonB-dependent receptor [Psychrobium sp. MM17-31]
MKLSNVAIAVSALMFTSVNAVAEETKDQAKQTEKRKIETISVTAQKRVESVQDIPIAITAFSGDRLVESGIENSLDLQMIDPALVITTNTVAAQPYLRGVGTDIFTPGAESSIATFVDDVYVSRTTSALQDFLDIERVDVVKGPQGVLFGRNAVGGAINVYSNKPTEDLEAKLSATIGNFNKRRLEGMVNVPLVEDKVFWRFAALSSQRDGYSHNLHTGKDVDDDDVFSFRTHLRVDVTDDFTLTFSANHTKEDSTRNLAIHVDDYGISPASAADKRIVKDKHDVSLNEDSYLDSEISGYSMTANVDFDSVSFKSITAYRESDVVEHLDLDGTELNYLSNTPMFTSEVLTQEFQLVSNTGGDLDWVVGAFFLSEEATQQLNIALKFVPDAFKIQPDGLVETDAYALFGNVKYHINDEWAISGGIRYNNDERKIDFVQNSVLLADNSIIDGQTLAHTNSKKFNSTTPRLVVEYTPEQDLMFYGSASRGYKAGGFNTNVYQEESFAPEYVWAYEAGMKSTIWDGSARINGAAFYYDYTDMQLNSIPPGSSTGTFQVVYNAAAATVQGIELNTTFVPNDDWEYGINLQLLDAQFDDFVAENPNEPAAGEVNRSGERMPRAPEVSLSFTSKYIWLIGERALTWHVDARYESDQYLDVFQDDLVQRDSNVVINTRLNYEINDDMTVSAWVRNLTDEEVVQSSIRADNLIGTANFYAPPRTFGLTLDWSF